MGDVVVVLAVLVVAVLVAGLVARVRRGRGGPGPAARPPEASPPAAAGHGDRQAGEGEGGGAAAPVQHPTTPAEPAAATAADIAAGAPPGPVVRRPEAPPPPLATLLQGVQLPCGLVPSAGEDHPDPDRYLALVTAEAPPEDVGAAVADELERLGYRLHSLSEDEAIARRGDELVSLRLHPHADTAHVGGVALFPRAPAGTVGVELWAGGGPNPRLDRP